MPTFKSDVLIQELCTVVERSIIVCQQLKSRTEATLKRKPGNDKWNVLEVLYHLNSYNDYYLKEIKEAMTANAHRLSTGQFKSGVIGNYFANAMMPGADGGVKNVMKAPKNHVPGPANGETVEIDRFLNGQKDLFQLLKAAQKLDLTKITVPISISRFIRIRLGDTFRFLIAHQQRHFAQISRALNDETVRI
jgi:uncharacterized damage-inducible protein DinB